MEKELLEVDEILTKAQVFHNGCGIYFLVDGEEIVYVGCSKHALTRVANHIFNKKFDRCALLPCTLEEMLELETRYIIKYRPRYNSKDKRLLVNRAPLATVGDQGAIERTTTILLGRDTTGPVLFTIITAVLKNYSIAAGLKATLTDFCAAAGISRQQMYLYNRGHRPAAEGLGKIATGLRAWGYTVNVII